MTDKELIEKAKEIANSISSPWGEGATYDSIFDGKAPKLDIEREFGVSHLDDHDWKLLVEDIVHLAAPTKSKKGQEDVQTS